MAKKRQAHQPLRNLGPTSMSPTNAQPDMDVSISVIDAVAEIVHQGFGRLLDATELRAVLDGWRPHCSMNYEYVFAWKPSFDPSALEINWNRPQMQILRRVVKDATRREKIRSGRRMTMAEKHAYRLELARRKHGYRTAEECVESGTDCKWVDLSFVSDSKGRDVFVLEMADAAAGEDDDWDSLIDRLDEIWHWKSKPLLIAGPFASSDEAEAWMADNGAFKEAD